MPISKGQVLNPNGRPLGSTNKKPNAARQLFIYIMEGQVSKIEEALKKVEEVDPAKYLELLSKFFPYFVPKKVDITTDGNQLQSVMTVPEVLATNLLKSIPEKTTNDLDTSSEENK